MMGKNGAEGTIPHLRRLVVNWEKIAHLRDNYSQNFFVAEKFIVCGAEACSLLGE